METPIIAVVIGVVGLALLFIIMRRVLRMAIRLVLIGLVLFALLIGGVFWWWNSSSSGGTGDKASPARDAGTQQRRGNSR